MSSTQKNVTDPPAENKTTAPKDQSSHKVGGFLGTVERLGNLLPHPLWIFVILGVITLLASWIGNLIGMTAINPKDQSTVEINNLLSTEGFQRIISEAVKNFTSFPPLGVILTVMLGVAVAEYSGLIAALVRVLVTKVSPGMLTFIVALTGVTGSVASDAIYAILIPLGAMAFRAVGRSPIVGAIVAFVSSSAGFNSSLVLNITDVLLAGISTSGAQIVDENYVVSPLANYFFSMASAVVLALIVTATTELFVKNKARELVDHEQIDHSELQLGTAHSSSSDSSSDKAEDGNRADSTENSDEEPDFSLTPQETKGLIVTGIGAVIFLVLYFAAMFVPGSPFQGEGGSVLDSPLITSITVPIALGFFLLGLLYGVVAGTITSSSDIPDFMEKGLKTLLPMLVIFFALSQFLAWFTWSNLGMWTAIKGSEILKSADLPPLLLFALFVLLVAAINLLITSGSAQWALMAPIVVPMFMFLGYSPEATQMLYRIGDSPTNIITPMSPYFALALVFLQRYYKPAGVGTLMSLTLPYSITMLTGWFLFYALWYVLGIPLGPGISYTYSH